MALMQDASAWCDDCGRPGLWPTRQIGRTLRQLCDSCFDGYVQVNYAPPPPPRESRRDKAERSWQENRKSWDDWRARHGKPRR
jgi:hypothetical protein